MLSIWTSKSLLCKSSFQTPTPKHTGTHAPPAPLQAWPEQNSNSYFDQGMAHKAPVCWWKYTQQSPIHVYMVIEEIQLILV